MAFGYAVMFDQQLTISQDRWPETCIVAGGFSPSSFQLRQLQVRRQERRDRSGLMLVPRIRTA